MGIRFTTNTWRAPLQLIDCWLPVQESRATATTHPTPRLLQRFAKAGWLRRPPLGNPPLTANAQRNHQAPRHPRLADIQCRSNNTDRLTMAEAMAAWFSRGASIRCAPSSSGWLRSNNACVDSRPPSPQSPARHSAMPHSWLSKTMKLRGLMV